MGSSGLWFASPFRSGYVAAGHTVCGRLKVGQLGLLAASWEGKGQAGRRRMNTNRRVGKKMDEKLNKKLLVSLLLIRLLPLWGDGGTAVHRNQRVGVVR